MLELKNLSESNCAICWSTDFFARNGDDILWREIVGMLVDNLWEPVPCTEWPRCKSSNLLFKAIFKALAAIWFSPTCNCNPLGYSYLFVLPSYMHSCSTTTSNFNLSYHMIRSSTHPYKYIGYWTILGHRSKAVVSLSSQLISIHNT